MVLGIILTAHLHLHIESFDNFVEKPEEIQDGLCINKWEWRTKTTTQFELEIAHDKVQQEVTESKM